MESMTGLRFSNGESICLEERDGGVAIEGRVVPYQEVEEFLAYVRVMAREVESSEPKLSRAKAVPQDALLIWYGGHPRHHQSAKLSRILRDVRGATKNSMYRGDLEEQLIKDHELTKNQARCVVSDCIHRHKYLQVLTQEGDDIE